MVSIGLGLTSTRPARGWSPRALPALFWAGALHPATGRLWQDDAGLVPLAHAGQPVGRLLARTGGRHAAQAASLSRPALVRWPRGGRRNLLLRSEDLSHSVWDKAGASASANAALAPDGTMTATRIVASAGASTLRSTYQSLTIGASKTYTTAFRVKADGHSKLAVQDLAYGRFAADFDLGAVTSAKIGGLGYVSSRIEPIGNGWFLCEVVWTSAATAVAIAVMGYPEGAMVEDAAVIYTADGSSGILVWGAQCEEAASLGAYQRVGSAHSVTEAGVSDVYHLWNDGGDSLTAQFEAGDLYFAAVDHLGAVSFSEAVSDGSAAVEMLIGERMADVVVLDRPFTEAEALALETYWATRISA